MVLRPLTLLVTSAGLTLGLASAALAHTEVSPQTVEPGATETFTVSTPGEREAPIVEVRVEVPEGFEVLDVPPTDGWEGVVEGDSVVWSGGEIPSGRAQEFAFEARAPEEPGEYAWRAFDRYADGHVSWWTGPPDSESPASVTTVGDSTSGSDGSHHHDAASGAADEGSLPETGGPEYSPDPFVLLGIAALIAAACSGFLRRRA